MGRFRTRRLLSFALLQQVIALFPEGFRNDRLHRREYPFGFWFGEEFAFAVAIRVVCPIHSFGSRVLDEPHNSRISEAGALSGSIPRLVEEPRNALLALVLGEQLVHQLADRAFGGVHEELVLLPHVSERRRAAQTLAKFCADFD